MATTIDFNPRSPYGERPIPSSPRSVRSYFNPRSPQGERLSTAICPPYAVHFNPRSPHGERHGVSLKRCTNRAISIHAPRMGSDTLNSMKEEKDHISIHAPRMGSDESPVIINPVVQFQSTLPAWGATFDNLPTLSAQFIISIHAPRMGSDLGYDGAG